MNRIIIVAATKNEIAPLFSLEGFIQNGRDENKIKLTKGSLEITCLITGVGMVATAFAVTKELCQAKYDLAINVGVGGCFDRSVPMGSVVNVTSDELPEMGAEAGDHFIPVAELGIFDPQSHPFRNGKLHNHILWKVNALDALKTVHGITVNKVHGNDKSIRSLLSRVSPVIESMEGAAFMYACLQCSIPCVQIRAVSNYVEKRNRDDWDVPLAIQNLNFTVSDILFEISERFETLLSENRDS
jgi:futalosine hydrolase